MAVKVIEGRQRNYQAEGQLKWGSKTGIRVETAAATFFKREGRVVDWWSKGERRRDVERSIANKTTLYV